MSRTPPSISRRRNNRRQKPRILLVEDHAPLARLRRDYFTLEGYDAATAGSLEAALTLLKMQRFDIVVTDIALHGGSGWAVAVEAKRRGLPVVLSSGIGPHTISMRDVDACPKPCSLRQLHALVKAALRRPREATAPDDKSGTKGSVRRPRREM